ncbi:YhdP family protein [Pleionea sediminis]|uniref:YhdP family protein n=1 Tax=Pleionea sediminis TaxID=2569479 RepID=UPI0011848672|nr:YhdP family protein [Pleionea sediminis]
MSIPKLFGKLINWLWLFLATTIITIAVLVSLARAFLPFIHVLHDDLESFLSEKLDANVSFESISGGWKNQGPHLVVKQIDVAEKDGSSHPVVVEELIVAINLWQSIFDLALVTDEIKLSNSRIEVDLESKLFQSGEEEESESTYSGIDIFIDTLLGQNDLALTDIVFKFYNSERIYPELQINELLINNFDTTHQLVAKMDQASGGNLKIIAELYGDPRLPESRVDMYFKSDSVHLADLPLFESIVAGRIKEAALSGEIWVDWSYSGWHQAFMDITLEPMKFDIAQRRFSYKKIESELIWSKSSESESRMHLNRFKATSDNNSLIDLSGLDVEIMSQPETRINLLYENIQPGKLNNVWALAMEEPELQNWFLTADPQLTIDSLNLSVEEVDSHWEFSEGKVVLSEIKVNRTESTPELPVLSGVVNILSNKVTFNFKSEVGELDYRPLFRWPIPINQLELAGEFLTYSTGSYLTFSQVKVSNPDFNLIFAGNLHFSDFSDTELSLQAEVSNTNIAKKSTYLPVAVMGDELVTYLDESILGGKLDWARLNMQVKLVDNMLEQPDATFDILGSIRQLDYLYQPGYPKLDSLDVLAFFDQNSMAISASNAKIYDLLVNRANATISDFSVQVPVLDLDLRATTDLNSAQEFVRNSELKNFLGSILDDIQPEGRFSVNARLSVPLEGDDDVRVRGAVFLKNNPLRIPNIDLASDNVTTRIDFTENGIWSKKVEADLFDGKVSGTIDTQDYDGEKRVLLNAEGDVDVKQVTQWLLPGNQYDVEGRPNLALDAWFCIAGCRTSLSEIKVSSAMSDVELNLPSPLSKLKDQELPLEISVVSDQESQSINVNIDSKLISNLHYQYTESEKQLVQGTIVITDDPIAVQSVQDHLAVQVNLQEVNLINWLDTLQPLFEQLSQGSNTSALPLQILFKIQTLYLSDIKLSEISARMVNVGDDKYKITFESKEGTGSILIGAENTLTINLDKLVLTEESWIAEKETKNEDSADFSNLPDIQLQCDDCQVKGIQLGQLSLAIESTDFELIIKGTAEIESLLSSELQFIWNNSLSQSSFTSSFTSNNIGGLLRLWGAKVGLKDSSANGQVSLGWNGGPGEFALQNLTGGLTVRVSEGYLEEVSDAKARIFSLFSLQSLLRRLTLDFSDIYKEGFFYDAMRGAFRVKDGKVVTDNFYINGKAAEVSLSGMVDLHKETLDQRALIIPKVTSSLPVLAGWAVEPATGILVWLISKIFEPVIDVVTNIEYRMVGSWNAPQVIELGKSTREVELTDDQLEAIRKVQSGEIDEVEDEGKLPSKTVDPELNNIESIEDLEKSQKEESIKDDSDNKPSDSVDGNEELTDKNLSILKLFYQPSELCFYDCVEFFVSQRRLLSAKGIAS